MWRIRIVFIDKNLKLVKKSVVNKLDLTILNDDYRMLKPIENEFVLFLALKFRNKHFNVFGIYSKKKVDETYHFNSENKNAEAGRLEK